MSDRSGCNCDQAIKLRNDLKRLHEAGMPTDIDAAVSWINRLIDKCYRFDIYLDAQGGRK